MALKKSAASSQPKKLVRKSAADIRAYIGSPKARADAELFRKHVAKHGLEPSSEELEECPEFGGLDAAMFRPVKKRVTTWIDSDVLAWLKSQPGKYQTNLNDTLRIQMNLELNVHTHVKKAEVSYRRRKLKPDEKTTSRTRRKPVST